jgi:MSHA biogenesis protein MshP
MNPKTALSHMKTADAQRGLGAVMAIVILLILASLAGALLRFGATQQISIAQDVLMARAEAALRAGSEWGKYQALQKNACASSATLDLRPETGFRIAVDCEKKSFNEGKTSLDVSRTVNVFTITATACNSVSSCPDNSMATSPTYIERQRVTIVTDE